MVRSNIQGKFGIATQRLTIADHFFPIKPVHSFREPIRCDYRFRDPTICLHIAHQQFRAHRQLPLLPRRPLSARPCSPIRPSQQTNNPRRPPLQPHSSQQTNNPHRPPSAAPPALAVRFEPVNLRIRAVQIMFVSFIHFVYYSTDHSLLLYT